MKVKNLEMLGRHWEAWYTVIRFVSISAKFGICTGVGLNGTPVEAKIRIYRMYFFYKCENDMSVIGNVYWIDLSPINYVN